jgi:hypothetical protein
MDCPVCGAAAQLIEPPTFDAKSLRCSECGDYDISGCTWELGLLPTLHVEQRRKALANAKRHALTPRRPVINSYMIERSSADLNGWNKD